MGFILGCIHVWTQHPLLLCVCLICCAETNLIRLQLEPWAELFSLYSFVVYFSVNMVAERNVVISVGVGHDSLCVDFGHWPEVL